MPQTILILGAGASFPYGFPLGTKLIAEILDYTRPSRMDVSSLFNILSQRFSAIYIQEFRNDLGECDINSIDSFLYHKQQYVEIGKACIAYILLECENNSDLVGVQDDNWYKYLWTELSARDAENFDFKIYTFNYERSITEYLKNQTNSLFTEQSKRQKYLNNIQIIHLHGNLGNIEYGKIEDINTYKELKKVADHIKVIFEVKKDENFKLLQKEIKAAEHVVFVGFGFHEDNMKRLGFLEGQFTNVPKFYASTYDLKTAQVESKFERFVKAAVKTSHPFEPEYYRDYAVSGNSKNLEFLKEKFPFHLLFKTE